MKRRPTIRPDLLSGLALPAAAAMGQPALAQDQAPGLTGPEPHVAPDGKALTGITAAQLFDIADQAQVAGRIDDAEAIYTSLSHDPDVQVRSEARFRLGMMMAQAKRYTYSGLVFRAILDEQPDAARVRLELARVMVALGDDASARQQIRQAQASGLPPDVAQVVDRFASALRSTKTFGGNIEFAMAPDSNVNRATDAKQLDTVIAPLTLSDDARAKSGVGAHVTGQVYARVPLTKQLSIVPRLSGDGTFYRKSQFNDVSGSALIGLEWSSGKDRLLPSVGVTWRTYGGDPYARTLTADMRWTRRIGLRAQSDVGFSYGRSDYRRNSLQDGNLFRLTVGVERALTARSGVGVTLGAMRQTARDPGYATASGGVTVLGWRDMGKMTVFANATAWRLESDKRMFPFTDRRKEWFLRGTAGATFRQVKVAGFSPVVRVAYERNISTVGLYDYRRTTVDVGITRAF